MKVKRKARRLFIEVEISAEDEDDAAKALRALAAQFEGDDEAPLSTFGADGGFAVSMMVTDNWLNESARAADDIHIVGDPERHIADLRGVENVRTSVETSQPQPSAVPIRPERTPARGPSPEVTDPLGETDFLTSRELSGDLPVPGAEGLSRFRQ